jgi:hypothetical protein
LHKRVARKCFRCRFNRSRYRLLTHVASTVEIKIREYGLKGLEVKDNGKGINKADFKEIARAHSTSKISAYNDLASVQTYGFRGEALNSLCLMSDLTIGTSSTNDSIGNELKYDKQGNLVSENVRLYYFNARLFQEVREQRLQLTTFSLMFLFEGRILKRIAKKSTGKLFRWFRNIQLSLLAFASHYFI